MQDAKILLMHLGGAEKTEKAHCIFESTEISPL